MRPDDKILALDQATQTGYAVGDAHSFENRTVESGVFKMPKRTFIGERLLIFETTLIEIVQHYKPVMIVWETPYWPQPRERKTKPGEPEDDRVRVSAEVLQFLQKVEGVLQKTVASLQLPGESYYPASWRKTALGYGRKPYGAPADHMKKAMVARARQLGYAPGSEDEADAIGILMHALHGPPANERAQGDIFKQAERMI